MLDSIHIYIYYIVCAPNLLYEIYYLRHNTGFVTVLIFFNGSLKVPSSHKIISDMHGTYIRELFFFSEAWEG